MSRRMSISLSPTVAEWLDSRAALAEYFDPPIKEHFTLNRIINRALERMAYHSKNRMKELKIPPEAMDSYIDFLQRHPATLDLPFMAALDANQWPTTSEGEISSERIAGFEFWDSLDIVDRFIVQEMAFEEMARRNKEAMEKK